VVVPRLTARLLGEREGLPFGTEVWTDTAIELPGRRNLGTEFHSVLDGNRVTVTSDGETRVLRAAHALARWPVALLTRVSEGAPQ